jgi:O-antigen/teichoic acid export membrane protein|nr:oligosaccharide flippase family protein [Candidatus Krumholzibacteria bacterium]
MNPSSEQHSPVENLRSNKGILHNLSILTMGQIVSQLANVAALVFLAGTLGPHWFGVVQIGVAAMGYALISAEWGMMALGIREVSRLDDPREIYIYATRHCGILAIQAAVVLAVGLVALPFLSFTAHDPWIFVFYLLTVVPQVYTQGWVAVGLERMTWVGLSRITRSLLYVLGIFLALPLLARHTSWEAARWVPVIFLTATGLSNLVVNVPLSRWFGRFIHPHWPTWSECRRRWKQSSAIGANSMVLRILFNIDIIILGTLASPEIAGNYAAAAKIVFFLVVAMDVLWGALLPRLSRMATVSRESFRLTFNLFFGTVSTILAAIALGGWLVGPELVAFLYQDKFPEAGGVFQVLAISYPLLALSTFLGNTLLAQDRQRWYLLPLIVSSLAAVIGVRLLTPEHGGLGASWGMLMAHGLLFLILVAISIRNFSRLLVQTWGLCLPAYGAMAWLVMTTESWHVVLRVVVGGLVFFLLAAPALWRLRMRS